MSFPSPGDLNKGHSCEFCDYVTYKTSNFKRHSLRCQKIRKVMPETTSFTPQCRIDLGPPSGPAKSTLSTEMETPLTDPHKLTSNIKHEPLQEATNLLTPGTKANNDTTEIIDVTSFNNGSPNATAHTPMPRITRSEKLVPMHQESSTPNPVGNAMNRPLNAVTVMNHTVNRTMNHIKPGPSYAEKRGPSQVYDPMYERMRARESWLSKTSDVNTLPLDRLVEQPAVDFDFTQGPSGVPTSNLGNQTRPPFNLNTSRPGQTNASNSKIVQHANASQHNTSQLNPSYPNVSYVNASHPNAIGTKTVWQSNIHHANVSHANVNHPNVNHSNVNHSNFNHLNDTYTNSSHRGEWLETPKHKRYDIPVHNYQEPYQEPSQELYSEPYQVMFHEPYQMMYQEPYQMMLHEPYHAPPGTIPPPKRRPDFDSGFHGHPGALAPRMGNPSDMRAMDAPQQKQLRAEMGTLSRHIIGDMKRLTEMLEQLEKY